MEEIDKIIDRIRAAYEVQAHPEGVRLRSPRTGQVFFVHPTSRRLVRLAAAGWEGTEEDLCRLLMGEAAWQRAAWAARWGAWDPQAVEILSRAAAEVGALPGEAPEGEIHPEATGGLAGGAAWVVGRTPAGGRVLEIRLPGEEGYRHRYSLRSDLPPTALAEAARILDRIEEIRVGVLLGSRPIRSCQGCRRPFHLAEGAEPFALARLAGWIEKICPACRTGLAFAEGAAEGIWIPGALLRANGSLRPGPLPPRPEAVWLEGVWAFPEADGFRRLLRGGSGMSEELALPEATPPPRKGPDGWIRAGPFQISPDGAIRREEPPSFLWAIGPEGRALPAEVAPGVWRIRVGPGWEIHWEAGGWLRVLPPDGPPFAVPADGAAADVGGQWIALRRWPPEARWGDLGGVRGVAGLPEDPVRAAAFPLGEGWLLRLGREAFRLGPGEAVARFPLPGAAVRAWEVPGGGRVLTGPEGTLLLSVSEALFLPAPVGADGVAVGAGRAAVLLSDGALIEMAPGGIRILGRGFRRVAAAGSVLAALDRAGRIHRFWRGGKAEVLDSPASLGQPDTDLRGLAEGIFLAFRSLSGQGWVVRGRRPGESRWDPVRTPMLLSPRAKEIREGVLLETPEGWWLFPRDPSLDPIPMRVVRP